MKYTIFFQICSRGFPDYHGFIFKGRTMFYIHKKVATTILTLYERGNNAIHDFRHLGKGE